jgi:aspartate carbamoyltransferase catalytic subunit
LVGPRTLLPVGLATSDDPNPHPLALPAVQVDHDFDRAIEGADVVMALRLQHERMRSAYLPSLREYAQRYQITAERLQRAADGAIVMHPGPMNEGIEIAPDVAHGLTSQVELQVQHGVAMRMAVLYLLARNTA